MGMVLTEEDKKQILARRMKENKGKELRDDGTCFRDVVRVELLE